MNRQGLAEIGGNADDHTTSVSNGVPMKGRVVNPRILVVLPDTNVKRCGYTAYFEASAKHYRTVVRQCIRGSRMDATSERGIRLILRLFRDYAQLASSLYRNECDVVHLNTSFSNRSLARDALSVVIAKLFRRKVMVFFHGWKVTEEESVTVPQKLLLHLTYFRADAICVLANRFRTLLRAWGYDGPVYVESTIVDDDLVTGDPAERRRPDGVFEVLFLARLATAKGIFESIQAVAELRKSGLDARLLIAGTGDELEAVEAEAQKSLPGAYEMHGYVTGAAKSALFRRAHVYVLPSDTEGMPTSVLEAMALGLPVVTRAVGGLADFFVDGQMGYLAANRDAEEIAGLLLRLASDEDKRLDMARHNAEYARSRFLASSVVRRIEDIYRTVAQS